MLICHVCNQNETTDQCPQCERPVCPDCLNDGKCPECSQESQSDTAPVFEQEIPLPQTLPPELRRWNWGAFGCGFIWAASMKLWGWAAAAFLFVALPYILGNFYLIFLRYNVILFSCLRCSLAG